MSRFIAVCPLAMLVWLGPAPAASAQAGPVPGPRPVSVLAASVVLGDLRGTVLDDRGQPLGGAVVSAVGGTSAFAVSDQDGSFVFRHLPAGPYLLRAHLQGYIPPRARIVQVNAAGANGSTISLTRRSDSTSEPQVLEAGIGGPAAEDIPPADTEDHGEIAWRLRHLKRSVLKDADPGIVEAATERPFLDDAFGGISRAMEASVRLASAWFTDLPVRGQFNLLTSTSFDRPQDLFSQNGAPRGVTSLSLTAPTGGGDWAMRGGMTQGDLASWVVAGSYVRRLPAVHQFETGLSYGMQRYLGGNVETLAAMPDGSRTVGAIYASDHWSLGSRVTASYGAKYARYDYLVGGLLSPRATITVAPGGSDSRLRVHGTLSHHEMAPGAEEFLPPSTGLWLPPERTFSPVSPHQRFARERIDHAELAAERVWAGDVTIGVRAFEQRVDDQIVTLFGVALSDPAAANIGHYYVASGGDFDARGWGLSFSRPMTDSVRASVNYTQTDADWVRPSPDRARLARVAGSATRNEAERTHDLTTSIEGALPVTSTRVFAVYRINSGFAAADQAPGRRTGARFEVQLNQALPFMNFTSAQWEMLVAVRNLFKEELVDASIYDELLVVRPPKRVVGGLTVRF